jgi:hypothetical protein
MDNNDKTQLNTNQDIYVYHVDMRRQKVTKVQVNGDVSKYVK